MKRQNTSFYKGLAGFTRATDQLIYDAAEHSVYRWWWEFMRLSPVFWYAQRTGLAPVDPNTSTMAKQAGDLSNHHFMTWWRETGSKVFAEERLPRKLRLLDVDSEPELELHPQGQSVIMEVPLSVTTRTLMKQFRALLAQQHDHKPVDVLAHSSAAWRLHTKRYNLNALENQYWVLVYKLLYPNIAVWRIGDRLQISPGLTVRDIDHSRYSKAQTNPRDKLQATVGRYLYKAQRALSNAECGNGFPNNTERTGLKMPFGKRHQADYLAATTAVKGQQSPWHQWLHEEFHEDLVYRIKNKNRLRGMIAADLNFIKRFPAFVAGTSDLIV